MKKQIFYIVLAISIISCKSSTEQNSLSNISLNGSWKFNTIPGQGYNYINVIEEETDIIIDNDDEEHVEIDGRWRAQNVGKSGSKFYGKNYLARWFKEGAYDGYVRFHPEFKTSGQYEVFVRYPFTSHMTAEINIVHNGGKTSVYRNQRIYNGEWLSVGIFDFDKGKKQFVEITAITPGEVSADAVMFKPVSKEVSTASIELPKGVFKTDYDDSEWDILPVPGHWGMLNDYANYNGLGWYRKAFTLPKNWLNGENEKAYLKFGGVYHVAKVYLNGQFIGRHQGGFTPFEFDVTEQLNGNGENLVALEVDNNFMVSATWNWGGIIRDVSLYKTGELHIKQQYIHGEPNLEDGTAELFVKVTLQNNSGKAWKTTIQSELTKEGIVATLEKDVEIPANSIQSYNLKTSLNAEDVDLWHFDSPTLYTATTSISSDQKNWDERSDNFGIRKVEVSPDGMLLNGERVRTGGFNRVSEQRYYGSSEPLEVLEHDVDLMKEAGANFMRIMHGNVNEKLIELCDRKGILIFEEVNVRDLTNPEFTAPGYPMIREWIKGMIERDINHPSIVGWSVGNELSDHKAYAKEMIAFVKEELDPYRLVTCVSNSGQKDEYTRETDPNTDVDIIMHNLYDWQGTPQEVLDILREKWPEKAIFLSEHGLGPIPSTSLNEDIPEISDWMNIVRGKNTHVIGTSLWTFNDYRSGYAGTTASENRVWGVVNVWGQKRRFFDRIKRENSPLQKLEIMDPDLQSRKATVTVQIKEPNDYPSYALKGYTILYALSDNKGIKLHENEVALPDLEPGADAWNDSLSWPALSSEVYGLTVHLMSPTGYSRHSQTIHFQKALAPKITGVIGGMNSLRVYFDHVYGAESYVAKVYGPSGKPIQSDPTIESHIDIESLAKGQAHEVEVLALNSLGEGEPSVKIDGKTSDQPLPPIVWKSFIANDRLVVGYSSDFQDSHYTIKYGIIKDKLDKEFASNVRGMMSIGLEGENEVFFKIRRIVDGRESNWSQVNQASIK